MLQLLNGLVAFRQLSLQLSNLRHLDRLDERRYLLSRARILLREERLTNQIRVALGDLLNLDMASLGVLLN